MAILRRHANSFGWLKSSNHPFAQVLRIAGLLENGQQANSSIQLPAALVPHFGCDRIASAWGRGPQCQPRLARTQLGLAL